MKKSKLWIYILQASLFVLSVPVVILVNMFLFEVIKFSISLKPFLEMFRWPLIVLLFIADGLFLSVILSGIRILFDFSKEQVYSNMTIHILHKAYQKALIITGIFVSYLPFFYISAELDDAPGLVLVGAFLVGLAFALALLLKVFTKLVIQALILKNENDLVV
jgi:Protein of unknown function (DUF2975)